MLKANKNSSHCLKRIDCLGYSLMEIMVALSIFSVMMLATMGIFKSVIEGQRTAIIAQSMQEGLRYTFEVLSKDIRQAQVMGDCTAIGAPVVYRVYGTSTDNTILYYRDKQGACVSLYIDDYTLMINRNGNIASTTPNEILITNLDFDLDENKISSPIVERVQPRITMRLRTESKYPGMKYKHPFRIQTTIASRLYE